MTSLGALCEIVMGQAPAGDTYNVEGVGIPLIAGASDFGAITPSPTRFTSHPTKLSRQGDIILCVRATIGDLNWSDRDYCLGRGVAAVRVNSKICEPRYIWWGLDFNRGELSSRGRGATFKQITRKDIESLDIPLPPLDEQRRIAAILDQADALRRKRQEALSRANSLGWAMFRDMFNLSELGRRKLSDLVTLEAGLVDPTLREYACLPHIGPEHIAGHTGELGPFRTAGEDGVTSGKFLFDVDCILYSKIRPNLNKVALAPVRGVCSADMYPIRPRLDALTRTYLWFLLRSDDFLSHAGAFSNRANIPKINRTQLLSYNAPVPSIEDQREFDRRWAVVDEMLEVERKQGVKIDTLFSSLQHRAFNGQL